MKESIVKFVACCEKNYIDPRIDYDHLLNTTQIRGGILQNIGIVPVRMKELEAKRRVECQPCRRVEDAKDILVDTDSEDDFVVDDNESSNLEEIYSRVNESEASVNNLHHERMLELARLINEPTARSDDLHHKRLLDRRGQLGQRKQQRNKFIDDEAAVEDDNKDEDEDEDDDENDDEDDVVENNEDDDGDKDNDGGNEFE
jgi:hypothetical protein